MGRGKRIIVKKTMCDSDSSSSSCTCSSSSSSPCSSCKHKNKCSSSGSSISCSDTCGSSSSSCGSSSSSSSCRSQPRVLIVEANSSRSCSSYDCGGCGRCSDCRRKNKRGKKYYGCGGYGGYGGCGGCGNCNNCRGGVDFYGGAYYEICGTVRPVKNFSLLDGTSCGEVKIHISINCKTVTLQWEGFTGEVDSSNAAYLYVNQCFRGLPKKNVFGSYLVNFKGGDGISTVEVLSNNDNTIRWYLTASRKGNNVSNGDSFTVYPGSITYILDPNC